MFAGTTPYEVLGLAPGCSLAELRAQYRRLAAAHHPDKHGAATEEVRNFHQERFKEVSVAYHLLLEETERRGAANTHNDTENPISVEEWIRRWERMERVFQEEGVWSKMGNILKSTLSDVATRYVNEIMGARESPAASTSDSESDGDSASGGVATRRHSVRLPVSLEEICTGAVRRVRLFLRGMSEPVFVEVDCSKYPEALIERADRVIHVQIVPKDHPTYSVTDIVDPYDLYTTIHISLFDHFFGCKRELVLPNGQKLDVVVPAYLCAHDKVISYKGHGLLGRGDLYVSVEVDLPGDADSSSRSLSEIYNALVLSLYAIRVARAMGAVPPVEIGRHPDK